MKVCILSDSHDHIPLLEAAVKDAISRGAEQVLHCGDLVAPSTLKILNPLGLPIHVIHGNNQGDLHMLSRIAHKEGSLVNYYGQDVGLELAGRKIFIVHYPHYAKAMATTGDYDLVCCGHSHKTLIQKIPNMKGGNTVFTNPGTVGGVGKYPSTYILGDLDTMEFEVFEIEKTLDTH